MRVITHELCFELAEDLLVDLNSLELEIKLGGPVNLTEWTKVKVHFY